MYKRRTITVHNQTGSSQDYSLISGGLFVSGGVSGTIKLNVVQTAFVPAASTCQFVLLGRFYAVSGNYRDDKLAVNKAIPITLGSQDKMGSTVSLSVLNREVPDINEKTPGEGKIGNIQLSSKSKSGHEFTFEDATNQRLFVGIAAGEHSEAAAKAVQGTFMPRPNAKYQVMPPSTFHVATGDVLKRGQVVKIEDLENSIVVNFEVRRTDDVKLVHDNYNIFSFKTD